MQRKETVENSVYSSLKYDEKRETWGLLNP